MGVSAKPFQIIKDNDIALIWIGFNVFKHIHHAFAVHKATAARNIVRKDIFDLVAMLNGMYFTALLLAGQSRAMT
nr:hypothetical protein [Paraglaciecola marina]